jgi:hypothetical protein
MFNKNRVFAFLLFSQVLHLAGCQLGKVQIDYVFPDGFRGAAVIREHQPNGISPCKFLSFPGTHRCVLNFPNSGILTIQDESPGTYWHNPSARYASGTVIPVPDSTRGIIVSNREIGLWTFGSVQNDEDWLFVGTEDEFMKFKEEKQAHKYPDSPTPP